MLKDVYKLMPEELYVRARVQVKARIAYKYVSAHRKCLGPQRRPGAFDIGSRMKTHSADVASQLPAESHAHIRREHAWPEIPAGAVHVSGRGHQTTAPLVGLRLE
jgi:hypothetical protein